jgi:hypothetical protein
MIKTGTYAHKTCDRRVVWNNLIWPLVLNSIDYILCRTNIATNKIGSVKKLTKEYQILDYLEDRNRLLQHVSLEESNNITLNNHIRLAID